MSIPAFQTPYNGFAWFYDRYWGEQFAKRILPHLEQHLLSKLPDHATLLDLCCGTGHIASYMIERGFRVFGVDNSAEMLAFARQHAPQAHLIESCAEDFVLPELVDAAYSVYDSLNHVMQMQELKSVFQSVYAALRPGGLFFFDLNVEEGYMKGWKGSFAYVEDDHCLAARSAYDPTTRIGQLDVTMFRLLNGSWNRHDEHFPQYAYQPDDVSQALRGTGFSLDAEGPSTAFGMFGGRHIWLARRVSP